MTTFVDLQVEVKEHLNMRDTTAATNGNPNNVRIKRAINQARRMIYRDMGTTFQRRFATSTTLAYTADTESVQLPAAVRNNPIMEMRWLPTSATDSYVIDPLQSEEFRNLAVRGTACYYAIIGEYVYLRPRPPTAGTLTMLYNPTQTDLSADADTPSELHADYHHLISLRAAINLRRVLGDDVEALKEWYDEDFSNMVRLYEDQVADNHIVDNLDHEEETF